jgi:hypothetical protein
MKKMEKFSAYKLDNAAIKNVLGSGAKEDAQTSTSRTYTIGNATFTETYDGYTGVQTSGFVIKY